MKKRIINIVFYVIFIGIILALLIFNKDFKSVKITNKNYSNYKNYKYVTLDLRKATLDRLAYKIDNKEYNVYSLKINDKYLLVYLNKNTALTKNVNVIKYNEDKYSRDIKSSLINDKDIKYYNGYYSNISYESNDKMLDIKRYVSYGLIGLIIIFIFKDIIMMFKKV